MEGPIAGLLGIVIGLTLGWLLARMSMAAARVERKVDLLLRHAGVDVAKLAADEAGELVRSGKKIEAIKAYRDLTGCGLAEAKAKVESLG